MSTKTFYVESGWRHVGTGASGRTTPAAFVSDDSNGRPVPLDNSIGLYEVRCSAKDQAQGIVLRWLLLGRPAEMTVRAVWESQEVRDARDVGRAARTVRSF